MDAETGCVKLDRKQRSRPEAALGLFKIKAVNDHSERTDSLYFFK